MSHHTAHSDHRAHTGHRAQSGHGVPSADGIDDAGQACCANCGAGTHYHFCAVCGQETALHPPSAGEFLHEFIGHHVALENKLWGSLSRLLFQPGALTLEYLAGRRVRYIQPLRLYLTLSVLFFALIKYSGVEIAKFDSPSARAPATAQVVTAPAGLGPKAIPSAPRSKKGEADGTDDNDVVFKFLGPKAEQNFRAFVHLPAAEETKLLADAFFEYVPYAMFALLPVFALYLKILYLGRGRRYGEHLLFALHANAFAYVLLGALMVAPWGKLQFVLGLWLTCYLPVAMRRVYGGGWRGTIWRWLLLMTLHLATMAAAILATMVAAVAF